MDLSLCGVHAERAVFRRRDQDRRRPSRKNAADKVPSVRSGGLCVRAPRPLSFPRAGGRRSAARPPAVRPRPGAAARSTTCRAARGPARATARCARRAAGRTSGTTSPTTAATGIDLVHSTRLPLRCGRGPTLMVVCHVVWAQVLHRPRVRRRPNRAPRRRGGGGQRPRARRGAERAELDHQAPALSARM